MAFQAVKRRIKQELTTLARRHLGLYLDPPTVVSDLGHPLGLIKRLGLECRGVIHVGANLGQEFDSYRRAALESVIYIEPIPEIFARLRTRISIDSRHLAINALCTDRDGDEVEFHVASNDGQSSSIFELGSHADRHPDVNYISTLRLQTTTLDRIIFETPAIRPELLDCLVLDVQGAEAKVFAGGQRTLGLCRFVFAEVSEGGLYRGDVPFEEIISILKGHGFVLRSLDINRDGWGNAFLVKPEPST
jgi:FkbM family methyltransferase